MAAGICAGGRFALLLCENIPKLAKAMARISESTVRRLSHYYRVLEEVSTEGQRMISSHLLAEREGITSAQVRKDLSYFGSFGRRGLGYNVEHLRDEIRAIRAIDLIGKREPQFVGQDRRRKGGVEQPQEARSVSHDEWLAVNGQRRKQLQRGDDTDWHRAAVEQ